jgi:hypothetical protein
MAIKPPKVNKKPRPNPGRDPHVSVTDADSALIDWQPKYTEAGVIGDTKQEKIGLVLVEHEVQVVGGVKTARVGDVAYYDDGGVICFAPKERYDAERGA